MSSAPRKPRIKVGVIGLGIIGSRVAANLRGAGHQVYVWSRSPHRAPNFLGSVVEVADLSDVIQVFVSDDAALLEVTRTIAAALSPRHVFACHATVSPEAARQAAAIIEGQGARYLDAPFTGSKVAAQNRQLVYYVGGGKDALEEIRPVLASTSKQILHVGGIGDASVLKIATNLLTASTVQTLAEALALVRAAGIPGQKLVEALEFNASRSGTSDLKLPAMIAQNFEPNFSLKHMLKDARLALDMADALNLSLPASETTAEVLSLGVANGWADEDFCCVTQLYPPPTEEEAVAVEPSEDSGANESVMPMSPEAPAVATKTESARSTFSTKNKPVSGQVAAGFGANALRAIRGLLKATTAKAASVRAASAPARAAAPPARSSKAEEKATETDQPPASAAERAPEEMPTHGAPVEPPVQVPPFDSSPVPAAESVVEAVAPSPALKT